MHKHSSKAIDFEFSIIDDFGTNNIASIIESTPMPPAATAPKKVGMKLIDNSKEKKDADKNA